MTAIDFDSLYFLLFGAIALVGSLFWLWMLVDCATKEDPDNKLVWVLIILLAGGVGAVIYAIVRRPRRIIELGQ